MDVLTVPISSTICHEYFRARWDSPRRFDVDSRYTRPGRNGKFGIVAPTMARSLVGGSTVVGIAADGRLCALTVHDASTRYVNAVFASICAVGGT